MPQNTDPSDENHWEWLTEKNDYAKSYYDQHTHALFPPYYWQMISNLDMWRNIWIAGTVTNYLQHKLYLVRTIDGASYHHFHRHLCECQVHPSKANRMPTCPGTETATTDALRLIPQCNVLLLSTPTTPPHGAMPESKTSPPMLPPAQQINLCHLSQHILPGNPRWHEGMQIMCHF